MTEKITSIDSDTKTALYWTANTIVDTTIVQAQKSSSFSTSIKTGVGHKPRLLCTDMISQRCP